MKLTGRGIGTTCTALLCVAISQVAIAQSAFKGYQAGEWAKVTAEAKREGRVAVYSQAVPSIMQRVKADFEKNNPGIVLEVQRPIPLVAAVDREIQTGSDGADVVINVDPNWTIERAKKNELIAPIGPATQGWPDRYVVANVAPILAMEAFVILYNANLVKGPVTGYDDLLRPEFTGKLAIPEINAPLLFAFYDWLEQTKGIAYLQRVAAQKPRIFASAVQSTQGISAGELNGSILGVAALVVPLAAQGSPIRMTLPNPSVGFPYPGMVLSRSKRRNASLVFMDYVMSRQGQTAWAAEGEIASPLPNIPKSMDANTITFLNQDKFTPPEVTNAFRTKWNSVFVKP